MVAMLQLRNYHFIWEMMLMDKVSLATLGQDEQKDAGETCWAFIAAQVKLTQKSIVHLKYKGVLFISWIFF